ncbi:MAG TPA: histidinol phosphatase, partial [bacterium]|nr:histidinol phosphatase [bacterium]
GTAYEDKYKISPRFAVELIEKAGGVAVLAHPTLNMKETHVHDMIKAGIHGIECIHPKHTADSTAYYRRLTVQYGLEESGGSDCHGRGQVPLIGQYRVPYNVVQRLKDRAQALRKVNA